MEVLLEPLTFNDALKDSPKFRYEATRHRVNVATLESKVQQVVKLCTHMVANGKEFIDSFHKLLFGVADMNETCFKGDPGVFCSFESMLVTFEEILKFHRVLIEQAHWSIIKNLNDFLKREVHKVHEVHSHFQRVSRSLDDALSRNAQVLKHKQQESYEAKNVLTAVGTCFAHTALDYIFHMNMVQVRKNHEIAEAFLSFLRAFQTYFHQGTDLFVDWEENRQKTADTVAKAKQHSKSVEKKMQDRHLLVPKEIFQHINGMPVETDVIMEGYLFKRASKALKTTKRRWFVIRSNQLLYRKRDADWSSMIGLTSDEWDGGYSVMEPDLRICLVRPAQVSVDRQHCFELVTPTRVHLLQADSDEVCNAWVKALQRSIEAAHHDGGSGYSPEVKTRQFNNGNPLGAGSKGLSPKTPRVLEQIMRIQGNDHCADCGSPNPKWASVNLGITLCIECCGVHRSLSVQISKPRSLTLDAWEPEQVALMTSLGNVCVNRVYLANAAKHTFPQAIKSDSIQSARETWIRAKYVEKRFVLPPSKWGLKSTRSEHVNLRDYLLSPRKTSYTKTRSSRTRSAIGTDLEAAGEPGSANALRLQKHLCCSDSHLPTSGVFVGDSDSATAANLSENSYSSENLVGTNEELSADALLMANRQLFSAARRADLPAMLEALAHGGQVNFANTEDQWRYPLHQAVASGSLECSEFLLLNGAKINVGDSSEQTPLHIACEQGQTRQVCQLLKRHANQDLPNSAGQTPLDIAIQKCNADLVTLLRLARLNAEFKNDAEWGGFDDETFTEVCKDLSSITSEEKR